LRKEGKCGNCRRLRKSVLYARPHDLTYQCIFTDVNDPCTSCQSSNLPCGEKVKAKTNIEMTMPPPERMVNDVDLPYAPTGSVEYPPLTGIPAPQPIPTLVPLLPSASTLSDECMQPHQPQCLPDNSATNIWVAMMLDPTFQWEGLMVPENLIEGRYGINWRNPLGGGASGRVLEVRQSPNTIFILTHCLRQWKYQLKKLSNL